MNFDLNINVQIGLSPQLATFLTALLENRPATPVQLPASIAPQPDESEKPKRARRTKTEVDAPEATAPVAVETTDEATTETPQPVEAQQGYRPMVDGPTIQPEKELTEEDIRAAMHRTRQRFEGEDYKDNPNSELYKKHHKALTAQFKQIAAILGADKPSALPADRRAAFIAECDALIIDDKGQIAPPPTPF
ncbi:MAG: hypothetical protein NC403_08805 [Muribaculaceae bacterium]|nr:hypothetical protein [Muribaculaceae bacterium]